MRTEAASPAGEVAAEVGVGVRLADLLELSKPRITFMVVITAGIGMLLASGGKVSLELAIHALVGTGLVAPAASKTILSPALANERPGVEG